MRKVLLVILLVFFWFTFAQKPSVQLILDVSGSMWLNLESGDTKIDAAKTVLIDFIGGLPSDSLNMGLRLYGANVSGIDPQACTDSQLIIPIDGLNKGGLINTVQSTDPKGGTPIVYALNEAIKDFDTVADDAQKLIILVTDGAESCGEDLDAAVQAVKAAGIELQVIGFGLAEKAASTFESVGAFANAMSALELATVLQETTQEITVVPEIAPQPTTLLIVPLEEEPIVEKVNSIAEKQSQLASLADNEFIILPERYYTNLLDLDRDPLWPDETGNQLSNGESATYDVILSEELRANGDQIEAADTHELIGWPNTSDMQAVFEFESTVEISKVIISFAQVFSNPRYDDFVINGQSYKDSMRTYMNDVWHRQLMTFEVNLTTDKVDILAATRYNETHIIDEIIFVGSTSTDKTDTLTAYPSLNYPNAEVAELQKSIIDTKPEQTIVLPSGYLARLGFTRRFFDETGGQLTDGVIGNSNNLFSSLTLDETLAWVGWSSRQQGAPVTFYFQEDTVINQIQIGFGVDRENEFRLPKTIYINNETFNLVGGEISDKTRGFISIDVDIKSNAIEMVFGEYSQYMAIDEIIFLTDTP